ncbi:20127_t:CDS:2 [Dentiscutata erythropus]|uniref:20127_t:CDS:1 n=1 Tax=Dentiscutata erythropus TaxID=1348616 RepID=A0A9N8YQB9_9GLOM|nr:20127_t:CDS:2 [Dentiscutata erythropus]
MSQVVDEATQVEIEFEKNTKYCRSARYTGYVDNWYDSILRGPWFSDFDLGMEDCNDPKKWHYDKDSYDKQKIMGGIL